MNHRSNVAIILLAAGSSSRMGSNKLALKRENKTILESTLESAVNSMAKFVVVVLGANVSENSMITQYFQVITAENKNWKKGIGSSIKCGIQKALSENPNLDSIIISVSDQPFLSLELFNTLIEKHRESGKPIVASAYAGSMGVPVLFDKSIFPALLSISDESGAKRYILKNAEEDNLITIPFRGGEIDIDTPEDFEKLISNI